MTLNVHRVLRPELCLWLLLASGCTRYVSPTPQVAPASQKLPLRAALVIEPELEARVDEFGRQQFLGIINKWASDTGEGLVPALHALSESLFEDVTVVERPDRASEVAVVLHPSVVELRKMTERAGYWFSFKMQVVITNASGEIVLNRTYEGKAQGSTTAAVALGFYAAAAVLTAPIEKAMATCLASLQEDIVAIAARLGHVPNT